MFLCTLCKTEKPEADFTPAKLRQTRTGRRGHCRKCLRGRYPDTRRGHLRSRHQTLRRHGLTPELYQTLLQSQGGVCAICSSPPGEQHLYVDHCHASGRVRGLLCPRCNHGLGHFKDSTERLYAAVRYLQRDAVLTAISHDHIYRPGNAETVSGSHATLDQRELTDSHVDSKGANGSTVPNFIIA